MKQTMKKLCADPELALRILPHRGKNEAETVQFLLLRDLGVSQRSRDLADFANLGPNQGR